MDLRPYWGKNVIVTDVDNKPRAKQRIIQTLIGIIGIVLATSLVSLVLSVFS